MRTVVPLPILSVSMSRRTFRWVERGCHQAEDEVRDERAKQRDPVDVAVEELAGEGEEGAVEDEEEKRAVEVGVVHDVRGGRCEGVEDCEGLRKQS